MEAKGCNQQWKMHLPEVKHTKRCLSPTTKESERGKTERKGREGPHKSVTMATTSRYLTDRQYVMRKPLFSAEQHASILKKTHPQKLTEKEKQLDVSRRGNTDTKYLTRLREDRIPESFSLSHSDFTPPSTSREVLDSPLGVSELQTPLCHKETTLGSPFTSSRSARQSLSSSILEVQRLNPPLRPRLTSTVLYPTYTPRSGHSRPGRTPLKLGGRDGRSGGETSSHGGHSKGTPESPYQANYWSCAIPKALPPSPDRRSAGWDPDKEYQALLDYTYPVRPGQVVSEWDSSEPQDDSLLQTDPHLQDSGIELDHLCSSTSLSGLDLTLSRMEQTRQRSTLSAGHRSPDLQGFTRSSVGPPSSTPLSPTDPMGLSVDTLDSSRERSGTNLYRSDGHGHQHRTLSSSSSTAYIRSTSVLPRCRYVWGDLDEEFWRLPEQLEELQLLSRQVREVTAQLSRPVTASWESLEPGTTSIPSSITLPEKHGTLDDGEGEEAEVKELQVDKDTDEGNQRTGAQISAEDHRDSETVRSHFRAWMEPTGGGFSRSSLREVEALVERLGGLAQAENQRSRQEDREQADSLMQHIQIFCTHLELLIQRLYAVSRKMEVLAAPTVDIDSVKSSLADYQSFQREVSGHQPLTSSVLHTGQLLLSCINTTAPLLRDMLLLIERQSGALQTHTEHFFSSILSAMDTLTQPSQPSQSSPVHQSSEEEAVGIQDLTL